MKNSPAVVRPMSKKERKLLNNLHPDQREDLINAGREHRLGI